MDWRLKAIMQGALARLPGGGAVNDALQRMAGGRRDLTRHIESKVREDWLVHAANLRELGFSVQGRDMLEIGTGWLPVLPLCFTLAGVRRCHTVDLNRHLAPAAAVLALEHLEPYLLDIADAVGVGHDVVRGRWERWRASADGTELLRAAGIEYRAPEDATRCGLRDGSVSLVFSNSVLEHVPESVLHALMRESHRILTPGGLALHCVNCGDHYAYFDRSITPIHYLRFTNREWRRWNNDLLFQNRLRPTDFLGAARAAGLQVVMEKHRPRPELLAQLPRLPIAEEFRHHPPDQLCSTSVDFAATRPS